MLKKQAHLLLNERLRNLAQHLGDRFYCFLVAGGQRAADTSIMGQRDQPPGPNGQPIMGQGMGALVQILQVSDASQDAHEEGQHFSLRNMNDALLRNGHLTQFLNQTDLMGELAPGYHQCMLGEHPLRQFRHAAQSAIHTGAGDV